MPAEEAEELRNLSLDILKTEKVTFGTAHNGRTYEEVWVNHPDWIKWFYQHYKTSRKAAHRRVIMLTEKRMEEAENLGPTAAQTPGVPTSAKSLAAPKVMPMRPKAKAMPGHAEGDAIKPEMIPKHGTPWTTTEDRLMIILTHLTPPTAATPSVISNTEIINEWHNPWNA